MARPTKKQLIADLKSRLAVAERPFLIEVPDWTLPTIDELPEGVTERGGTLWLKRAGVVVGVSTSLYVPGFRAATREEALEHAEQLLAKRPPEPGHRSDPEWVGPPSLKVDVRESVRRARGQDRAWAPCERCGQDVEHVVGESAVHRACR